MDTRARTTIAAIAASVAGALARAPGARGADELSGADKLRVIYSAEFRFTQDGQPIVPIAVLEGLAEVVVAADGAGDLRLLPEGDGGTEIRGESRWTVRVRGATPAKLRHHAVVWRGGALDGADADADAAAWQALGLPAGERARVFEHGALFAVAGEVLDRRERLVAVGPFSTVAAAEKAGERLRARRATAARGVYTELVDRPHGVLEAISPRGTQVRNEGVLWFAPAGGEPLRVDGKPASAATTAAGASTAPTTGRYLGRLYVTLDREGRLVVVNALPADRLLAGLVPAEMFPSAPPEALKAQAVAARGELLTKIGRRHAGEPFRICARTHCQVYAGAGRETPRTTAAVDATRGEVLFLPDGKDLVDTVYSANCGGHGEHNENAWPEQPASQVLRGRRDAVDPPGADPFARGVPAADVAAFLDAKIATYDAAPSYAEGRYRWQVTRTPAELAASLADYRLGDVTAIDVLERGVSGRALAVRVRGTRGEAVIRGEWRIRQAFGNLRSSLFVVETKGGAATFRGAGFGHGVGMCQTGAIGRAQAGKSYREILRHYYDGAVLRKLW